MGKQHHLTRAGTALIAALALTASSATLADGALRIGMPDDPPTLDQQVSTSDIGTTIALNIFETLYTFNAKSEPVPLLAKSDKVSSDGKTIEIELRKGVKFHNGDEMKAADVVASLKRWGEHGSRGPLLFKNVTSVEADGDYTVVLKFSAPYGPWKSLLSFLNGGPAIQPASIMNKASKEPVAPTDYIGTGPYKFKEWRQGRNIELVRFDDYAQPPGAADGYAGKRDSFFDNMLFIPTPDVNTRISGVRAGDFDYAIDISGDLFGELDASPDVDIVLEGAPIFGLVFMNSNSPLLGSNFKLRRAIQTAIDKSAAMQIAIGPERLWRANGSIYPKGTLWYSSNGIEQFSEGNAEKAMKMAEEAGYQDELIRFVVSTRFGWHYDTAVVYARQLLDAGFKVEMQIVDWPTLSSKRQDPDAWDMFFTHHGSVPDPVLLSQLNENYPGWWQTPEIKELTSKLVGTTDVAARKKTWDSIQGLMYEQVPAMKTGDFYSFHIASPKLKGLPDKTLIWPAFWNVSR